MSDPLPPALHQRVASRNRVAKSAREAAAHQLPIAAELRAVQQDLEEELEALLPHHMWRDLFAAWVLDDLHGSAQAVHTARRPDAGCTLCQVQRSSAEAVRRIA